MAALATITFAAGEDVVDVVSVYDSDGVSTVNTTGWTGQYYVTERGGRTLLNLASPSAITFASPLLYQASVTFSAAGTATIAPGYYDFSLWRTNAGDAAEVVTGTQVVLPPKPS